MRRVTIHAPFTDGLVTDAPKHALGPRMASEAKNMLILDGIATRRRGFELSPGAVGAMAKPINGVLPVELALAGIKRTLVSTPDGVFDEASGATRLQILGNGDVAYDYSVLPRCVYRDEVIFCHQDGKRGIRRYAGAGWASTSNGYTFEVRQFTGRAAGNPATIAMNTTLGSAEFTYTLPGTNSANIVSLSTLTESQPGWFVLWTGRSGPSFSAKIANVYGGDKGTLLSAISSGSWSTDSATVHSWGAAYPAVAVYSAGSITISGTTATGQGTQWSTGLWGKVNDASADSNDRYIASLLVSSAGTTYHRAITSVASDTSLTVSTFPATFSDPAQYSITKGLPFTEACTWKNSLCGAGVAQYPNRVYIAPPGWDLESPPGSVPPLRYEGASFANPDPNFFLIDFFDVPTSVDTDPVVALIPASGSLLVIKENSVHGIYGEFPSFSQSLIQRGIGCIDKRSAFSAPSGAFWAGRTGIYRYTPQGGLADITGGRVSSKWMELVDTYLNTDGFYCAAGEANGKLLVSIGNKVGGVSKGETLCFDIRSGAWDGFITNHNARYYATDRRETEYEKLYWAAADASDGLVLRDSGRMLDGRGPVADDGVLSGEDPPLMDVTTSTGLGRGSAGIDSMVRLVDCAVSVEVVGEQTGHAVLTPSVVTEGGIENQPQVVTSLPFLSPSPAKAAIQRSRLRVNRSGRTHAVRFLSEGSVPIAAEFYPATDLYPSETLYPAALSSLQDYDVKIHQITVSVRESRERA